ncbi:hypothetical protein AAFF_G00309600 [Aldrovandia affinis]|uniref:Uncharacterized protein n=1 Tax=Aldrovandia affinis TaxID=143900 RepID=A0AAD7SQ41_9TELE|nr:hypothetical protein AAFF_G00309600 [Aldrovandia affinis]
MLYTAQRGMRSTEMAEDLYGKARILAALLWVYLELLEAAGMVTEGQGRIKPDAQVGDGRGERDLLACNGEVGYGKVLDLVTLNWVTGKVNNEVENDAWLKELWVFELGGQGHAVLSRSREGSECQAKITCSWHRMDGTDIHIKRGTCLKMVGSRWSPGTCE